MVYTWYVRMGRVPEVIVFASTSTCRPLTGTLANEMKHSYQQVPGIISIGSVSLSIILLLLYSLLRYHINPFSSQHAYYSQSWDTSERLLLLWSIPKPLLSQNSNKTCPDDTHMSQNVSMLICCSSRLPCCSSSTSAIHDA